jgi:hypothetical protein
VRNYLLREPDLGEQRARAEASARYVDWLALRAREHGVPVIEPRPWSTALDRLCAALER